MVSLAPPIRSRSAFGFLRGAVLAVVALVSPSLVFVGLTLFTIGVGLWPIGLSLVGALGLGFFIPAMSSVREETRWTRMGGSAQDRCAHCRREIGAGAGFIRAPAPMKGVIHSTCYAKAFVRRKKPA